MEALDNAPTMQSERLQEFLAQQEIRDLLNRYFLGVDRRDWGMIRACFTPDCTAHYHAFKATDLESLMKFIMPVAKARVSTHFIGNQLIEVTGETARSETYCMINMLKPAPADGELNTVFAARYVDQLRRVGGRWKIFHREQFRDWTTEQKALPQPPRST